MAQVTFNYDEITICEGDSYDLLNFQTNEVIVPVGWEIVGWQGIVNTTVQPGISPSIYTLEYREIANPSQIFTKTLTISLRPKPTVSIMPRGRQVVCPGDNIQIQKIAADNYDNIYWQHIETGDKYYTDDINFIATSGIRTYKLIATNDNCAVLAQDEVEFSTNNLSNPIVEFRLATIPTTGSPGNYQHRYNYCTPVYLREYVAPSNITLYRNADHTSWQPYGLNGENDLYKITRYEITWDTEDAYTQGGLLTGQNYANFITIETDIYFKGCDITQTFTERRYIALTYSCEGVFQNFFYSCSESNGSGAFTFNYSSAQIIDVQFINKTNPGEYIPAWGPGYYLVYFDENVPGTMVYDLIITYEGLDGVERTYQRLNWIITTCQREMLINYRIYDEIPVSWGGLNSDRCLQKECYNKGTNSTPQTVEISICQGEPAYLTLVTAIGNPLEVVWDNEEMPVPWNPQPSYAGGQPYNNYQYLLQDGKHTVSIVPVVSNEALFKVTPQHTTIYSGTLFGVPFMYKVNVVNHHIVVTDTAMCQGGSIDLTTLERSEMSDGEILWSVSNTVVSPLIDTKYLAYGITKHKCKSQTDYTLTDEVLVRVDAPVWATSPLVIGRTIGNTVSLADNLNTNARKITWYDENYNPVNETFTVTTLGLKIYYAVVENACGADTVPMRVLGTPPQVIPLNDIVTYNHCMDSIIIDILANDYYTCSDPVVTISQESAGRLPYGASFELTDDNKIIHKPNFDRMYLGRTDSIQYTLTCGTISETAWVYVKYPTTNWLDVEATYNRSCFIEGETLEEEFTIRNDCSTAKTVKVYFTTQSAMGYDIRVDSSKIISINNATVDSLMVVDAQGNHFYQITLDPGGYVKLTGYYFMSEMLNYVGIFLNGMVVYNNSFLLNDVFGLILPPCPDRRPVVTDCETSRIFLFQRTGSGYTITQPPQLPGAVAALSQTGILTYTSPAVSAITHDEIKYEMMVDGNLVQGTVSITVLPCIRSVSSSYTANDLCNDDLCQYNGPSILINEVMINPSEYDGAIYGQMCSGGFGGAVGGEWIELYNPDNCNPVDISGYFFGNATTDNISPVCATQNIVRNLGAAFVLPEGTIVPPNGFCVLRGERSEQVDPARLVENGGNVVVIDLVDHIDRLCLNNGGRRFWLPNAGGWFGFYDKDGVPQDAVYWGAATQDICTDCNPCNPLVADSYQGELASLDNFPAGRKTWIDDRNFDSYSGLSPKRQPDGGNWMFNTLTLPTQGYCNGTCYLRVSSDCNGTATVTPQGGSGNFSYQWNDASSQTTATATGLCEGTYCCLITDDDTHLTQLTCVTVIENLIKCSQSQPCTAPSVTIVETNVCLNDTVHLVFTGVAPFELDYTFDGIRQIITVSGMDIMLVAKQEGGIQFIVHGLISADGCSLSEVLDEGIEINGVVWATRNVDMPGTFAVTPEGAGMFYQWGKNVGWSTTDPMVNSNGDTVWDYTIVPGSVWENDPCPCGWRPPTVEEQAKLLDAGSIVITRNGVEGRLFGTEPNTVFLPYAPGWREMNGSFYLADHSDYLTGSGMNYNDGDTYFCAYNCVWDLCFDRGIPHQLAVPKGFCASLRCVKEVAPCSDYSSTVTVFPIEFDTVNVVICPNDSALFNGKYYHQEGIYTDTLKAVSGCDNVVSMNLKVKPVYRDSPVPVTICRGDSIFFGGKYYKQEGIFDDTLKTVFGCDSIVALHLTIQDSSRITLASDNQYICQDGEQEVTLTAKVKAGNPSEIAWYDDDRTPIKPDGTSQKGNVIPLDRESTYWAYAVDPACGDSPYAYTTVYITNKIYLFLQADTNKVQMGDKVTLTVTPTNDEHGVYRWYDAFTGKLLGETTVNTFAYTLDEAGIYIFYVSTDNGYCPDVQSNNVEVEVADYFMIPDIITPYDRNGLNDTFMTPRDGKPGYRVEIYNRYQQKVFEGDNGWDGTYRGRLAEPGTYFFRIFMKDGRVLKGPLEVAKF